ncbi:hypothetical protein M426DRAFT_323527 [Hypoxylon sp. CI-4A]|nr:hypothetical protein M426DRAFT_323527 [Hypoxylon sp. CI-4A]
MYDRPPSATTSRISITGRRDFSVKFITSVDEIPKAHPHIVDPTPQVPAQVQAPPAMQQHEVVDTPYEPPAYWDWDLEAGMAKAKQHKNYEDDEEDDEGCHPFWMGWLDMLKGVGLIIGGALKIPLVIGHGIAKTLHFIPSLYYDETVRKWPKITDFRSSCVASFEMFLFGLFDGMTDWVVLPVKGAKKEGVKGFFKGIPKGFASIVFKPAAGTIGFATHPFYGIYKEASKFKLDIKREHRRKHKPRQEVGSLI